MKVSYHKSCYSESIKFYYKGIEICLISGMTSHKNLDKFREEMLTLVKKILETSSKPEQKRKIFHHLKNDNSESIFGFLKETIQSFPLTTEAYISCEGCGDINCDYEINI